jgi:HIT domain
VWLLAEDPDTLAFMDVHPANAGHCLIIPNGHWPTVFDIPADAFATVAAWRCALRLWPRTGLRDVDGIAEIAARNMGEASRQLTTAAANGRNRRYRPFAELSCWSRVHLPHRNYPSRC